MKPICPEHNQRFSLCPVNDTDVHVRLPKHVNLDSYLCIKTECTVRNDNTVAHKGKLYELERDAKSRKVMVQEGIDGSTQIMSHGVRLKCQEITERPPKATPVRKTAKLGVSPIPAAGHPSRRAIISGTGQRVKELAQENRFRPPLNS